MKKIFRTFLVVSLPFILSACGKDEDNGWGDVTDPFVGTYSISVTRHVVWGNDSGTISDTGYLHIEKVSETRVRTSGYFTTYGEVTGSSVYFESLQSSDGSGYFTTIFNRGTLAGNVLTFSANQSGKLASNGILYPYRSSDSFVAIKQY